MNRLFYIQILIVILVGCKNYEDQNKRIAVAKVGDIVLYMDQIPTFMQPDTSTADSIAFIQN